jgi:hypothetical protein
VAHPPEPACPTRPTTAPDPLSVLLRRTAGAAGKGSPRVRRWLLRLMADDQGDGVEARPDAVVSTDQAD